MKIDKELFDKKLNEAAVLAASWLIASFVVGLLFKGFSIVFCLAFWFLFIFPYLPWMLLVEADFIQKFAALIFAGFVAGPAVWFSLNMIGIALSTATYVIVVLLLFMIGVVINLLKDSK